MTHTEPAAAPLPEELLEHFDFAHALARALIHDPEIAHDVAQESLLAAVRRPPAIETSLRAWLGGAVRNLVRLHFRTRERRLRRETEAARSVITDAEDAVSRLELRREIVDAVLALREPYRSTVVMRYFEEMPPRAIAATLDVSVETVNTRLKRGLALLRECFDRRHGGDRDRWVLALAPLAARDPALRPLRTATSARRASLVTLGVAALALPFVVWIARSLPGGRATERAVVSNSSSTEAPVAQVMAPSGTDPSAAGDGDAHADGNAVSPRSADRSADPSLPGDPSTIEDRAAAAEGTGEIRVVDARDARPIPGATVTVIRRVDVRGITSVNEHRGPSAEAGTVDGIPFFSVRTRQELQHTDLREELPILVTDREGRAGGVPSGQLDLTAVAPGYAITAVEAVASRGESPVVIELAPGGALAVQGPRLPRSEEYEIILFARDSVPAAARARSQGEEIVIDSLPAGDYVIQALRVSNRGRPERVIIESYRQDIGLEPSATARVELFSQPGTRLEVTVAPPIDADVWLFDEVRPEPIDRARRIGPGRFQTSPVPPGRYRVRLERDGRRLEERSVDVGEPRGDRPTAAVAFTVATGRVRGRIFDRQGALASGVVVVPDARGPATTVEGAEPAPPSLRFARADETGRFEIADLLPGRTELWCAVGGSLIRGVVDVASSTATTIDFDHGRAATHRLDLTLLDDADRPVPALLFLVGGRGTQAPFAALDAELGPRGPGGPRPHHVYWLPADAVVHIGAYPLGGTITWLAPWTGEAPRKERVSLTTARSVVLRVMHHDHAVAMTPVELRPLDTTEADATRPLSLVLPETGALMTDEKGSLALPPLTPGAYELRSADGRAATFTVKPIAAGTTEAEESSFEIRVELHD